MPYSLIRETFYRAVTFLFALLMAFASFAATAAETPKAQPKEGRPFTPPLSERVPEALSSLPSFGTITWETTHMPQVGEGPYAGISGTGMVEIGGRIYIAGGFIPGADGSGDEKSQKTSRWTFCYDPATKSWTQLADMPFRREYTRAVAANGKMYLMGGGCQYHGEEPRYRPHADCAVFDPNDGPKGAWTTVASLNVPRTHMAVGLAGGKLVVAGGNEYEWDEQGYSHRTIRRTVDMYDPSASQSGWGIRSPIPGTGRGWCASLGTDSALYIFGGVTWNADGATEGIRETLRYDVASDNWTALSPPPLAISGWEGALYADRYALNVGGVVRGTPGTDEETIWSDLVIAYDLEQDKWLRVESALPPGAVFNDPGVVVIGDTIYVLGAEGPSGSHYDYFLIGTISRN